MFWILEAKGRLTSFLMLDKIVKRRLELIKELKSNNNITSIGNFDFESNIYDQF